MRIAPGLLCLGVLAPLASAAPSADPPSASAPQPQGGNGTIGLVLTDIKYALYQTADGKEECPAGVQSSEIEQWKAKPGFMEHMNKFGGNFQNRGPQGEMSNYVPLAIEDPLPWKPIGTNKGYGFNLDGTNDGRATAKACKHEKFTSAEGEQVDNQMARVLGCVQSWRRTGFSADFYSKEVETSPYNRVLVEITGVDNETNDPSVNVTIYKGRDRIVRTAAGNSFVPFMSHRIDDRFPQYTSRTRGKIVDGVLVTEPIPYSKMAMLQIQLPNERHLQDMVLKLKLKPDGAEGLMGGYEKLTTWWNNQSKSPASDIGRFSPALLYKSAVQNADGYPDPKTGQCTSISVAYEVDAVRALIVHPARERPRVANAPDGQPRVALVRN